MWQSILAIWGCIPEFTKRCIDMTNSSSAYLGMAGGALETFAKRHDNILNKIFHLNENILALDKKLESMTD